MKHKDAKKMRAGLLDALANGTQRPNPATGTMQTDGPMVQAPAVWQSAPDHPPTLLAYITAEEAAHLAKKDMHNSGVDEKPHFGPNGIPSFNGYDGSGGYDTGGDGGSGQGGVSDGTTGASVGADGSYTGVGGTYSDVNASLSGVAGSMLGEDRLTAPNLGVPMGPNSLYGAQYAGWLGNRIGEQMDRMAANPISSALNAGFGLIGGPLGMANTLSGWMGGPTVGSLATAGGRAAGAALGLNNVEGAAPTSVAAGPTNPDAPTGPTGPQDNSARGGYDQGGTGIDVGTPRAQARAPAQVAEQALRRALLYMPAGYNVWQGNRFVMPALPTR